MLKHDYYGNYTAESFAKLPLILQRFLSYTQYNTTSDPNNTTAPSTEAQVAYAQLLKAEFESVGLKDVRVTDKGIVLAYLPATAGLENVPAMGMIAHMDTSPEASGEPAKWQVVDYKGGDIVLNKEKNIVLTMERFPGVAKYAGEQLVVTDGTTLLGADDKAGKEHDKKGVEQHLKSGGGILSRRLKRPAGDHKRQHCAKNSQLQYGIKKIKGKRYSQQKAEDRQKPAQKHHPDAFFHLRSVNGYDLVAADAKQ